MTSLKRYLVHGLLFVLPFGITIWFLVYAVTKIDSAFRHLLQVMFRNSTLFTGNYVFGFSILILILLLLGFGWLATNVFGKLLRRWTDRLFESVPLVNKIYHFVKQVTTSFSEGGGGAFKRVVLLQYPRPGTWAVGLVSNENPENLIGEEYGSGKTAVFIASSPNPTSGFTVVVDKSECIALEMSVEDGMKFLISGGTMDLEPVVE